MNELRLNPDTGRVAERIPEVVDTKIGECQWFTYRWEPDIGLTVELLTETDVADWARVELREV